VTLVTLCEAMNKGLMYSLIALTTPVESADARVLISDGLDVRSKLIKI
jgi:hypothetical protein